MIAWPRDREEAAGQGRARDRGLSSALVTLLVEQAESARMRALYRQDRAIASWWGSRAECDSAIARLERETTLTAEGASEAFSRLDDLARDWHEVQLHEALREIARRMLRTHALRAGDALQLAAAVIASEQRPSTLDVVSLDDRMTLAARPQSARLRRGAQRGSSPPK